MPDTVCIIGTTGFIGSHLTDSLIKHTTCQVIGIDVRRGWLDAIPCHPRFEFILMPKNDQETLNRCIERSDVVIHLAALCNPSLYNTIPGEVIDSNFLQPSKVIVQCSRLKKHLIYFSTSEVYGRTSHLDTQQPLREDSTPLVLGPVHAQRWCYACAKQLSERLIFAYGVEKDLPYTVVRPFNFIGPRMDFIPGIDGEGIPRVWACFMDALLSGKPLLLVNGGSQKRAFTDITDAIHFVLKALFNLSAANKQIFNVGNPSNEISIQELAKSMASLYCRKTGSAPPLINTVRAIDLYGEGYEDSERRLPDISKAQKLLGWEPKISLLDSMTATIDWYLAHYGRAKS